MNRILLTLSSLCAALAVQAAPGDYLSKSATGTTTASVYFPAGTPLRVIAYDVTADNATNRVAFYPGTTKATLAKPATVSDTTLIFNSTAFTTNDVIFFQDATNGVAIATVSTNGNATNKTIVFANPIGTNLAIGDTMSERVETAAYALTRHAAANATVYYFDNIAALDTNVVLLLDRGSGAALKTATISTVVATTNNLVKVTSALPAVAASTTVYRQQTNVAARFTVAAAATDTAIYLRATNGMAVGTNLLVETTTGQKQIVAIDSLSGTNVTLAAGLSFAVTANDYVRVLGYSTTTKILGDAGDDSLILVATNGFSVGDYLVTGTTPPFRTRMAALASKTNQYAVTVASTFGAAADPPATIYKLTNTFTLILAAAEADNSVVADVSTGLASGEKVIISPASGGVFENTVLGTPASKILTTIKFVATPALSLAAGDRAWLRGTAQTTVVGNATLRREGEALFGVGGNLPLQVNITGAAACSINSVTVKYD